MRKPVSSVELANWLGGELLGETRLVAHLVPPGRPVEDGVAVAGSAKLLAALEGTRLAAVVVPENLATETSLPAIQVPDARLALAQLSALFDDRPREVPGLHPAATIHPSAELGPGVSVGPNAVVEAGAVVGANSIIGPGSVIGQGSQLGEGCHLHAKVVLYDGVRLGARVTLHSGVVIGADGFGYAVSPHGLVKIHHLAGVEIGDDVEIGANASVDRGTLEPTRIGNRCKIDNNCLLGHNVQVGSDTVIAGNAGIGGSTRIGSRVLVSGGAILTDHITVGDDARISFCAMVTKDVPPGAVFSGSPAMPHRKFARRLYLLSRLERIWQMTKGLERD